MKAVWTQHRLDVIAHVNPSAEDRSRLDAVCGINAHVVLSTLPTHPALVLTNPIFISSIAMRLKLALPTLTHNEGRSSCRCGRGIDFWGLHVRRCAHSGYRTLRHESMKFTFADMYNSADFRTVRFEDSSIIPGRRTDATFHSLSSNMRVSVDTGITDPYLRGIGSASAYAAEKTGIYGAGAVIKQVLCLCRLDVYAGGWDKIDETSEHSCFSYSSYLERGFQ